MWATVATLGCQAPPPDPEDTSTSAASSSGDASTSAEDTTSDGSGVHTVTGQPHTSTTGPATLSTTEAPIDCSGVVADLASRFVPGQPCEVLIHLDHADLILGYRLACGVLSPGWTSAKEVPNATMCCLDASMVYSPADSGPYYVVHAPSPDGPDGVAILSNHRGSLVLDATTALNEPGPIIRPSSWSGADELLPGMGCGGSFSLNDAASHNLEQAGEAIPDLTGVAAAISATALPLALDTATTPVRALVVRYALQEGNAPDTFVLLDVTGK